MNITKERFTEVVKTGFENKNKDIIKPFIDAYNNHFEDNRIYDIMDTGQFGLQGFVNEQGVDLNDLAYIHEDYARSDKRKRYYFYNDDGWATPLDETTLPKYIDLVFGNTDVLDYFAERTGFYEIMDTTNAHSPILVEKINRAWVMGNKSDWMHILHAIALRDSKELMDKGIKVLFPSDAYDNADLILMRVCDDNDLEVILKLTDFLFICLFPAATII